MNKSFLPILILIPSLSFGLSSYSTHSMEYMDALESVPPVAIEAYDIDEDNDNNFMSVPNETAGLSKDCCLFPMKVKATDSYSGASAAQRAFNARRDNGARLHAAADLYQSQYQPVYAIADGTILEDREPFYLGTNATVIEHTGGFIVRYGEIASNSIKPLKLKKEVVAGQLIGYIKKVNSKKVTSAMLHFELFSGKAQGPLTVKTTTKNKYGRRSDLMNPTTYLLAWEKTLR